MGEKLVLCVCQSQKSFSKNMLSSVRPCTKRPVSHSGSDSRFQFCYQSSSLIMKYFRCVCTGIRHTHLSPIQFHSIDNSSDNSIDNFGLLHVNCQGPGLPVLMEKVQALLKTLFRQCDQIICIKQTLDFCLFKSETRCW